MLCKYASSLIDGIHQSIIILLIYSQEEGSKSLEVGSLYQTAPILGVDKPEY